MLKRLHMLSRSSGLKSQLVRGGLGVGGLKLLSLPLTLFTSIVLARGLGPDGYGQYVFVLTVISLLALPIGPGLGQLITREVAKYHQGADWGLFRGLLRRAHQWLTLGSCVIAAAITLLAAKNASWAVYDRWTLLFLATPMLPLLGFNALCSATLRGLRHVFRAQLPELLVRPGLHLVIASSLLVAGILNPATAFASQFAATALACAAGVWLLRRLQPSHVSQVKPSYRDGDWARAILPFILLAAVGNFNGQIGIVVLGWLGTDAEVAALRVAQTGANLVVLSLGIANLVIGPHIARARHERDSARLQSLSRYSARAALAVSIPIAIPMILLGGPIVGLVFGDDYRVLATLPLAILAIGQLVNVAFGSVGLFLTMSGCERETLVGQIIALLVNMVTAVLLVPLYGVVGAALAVTIGLVTWNVALAILFVRRLGLRPSAF
jgi:O-antigen/teichoic acid export membrane protein